MSNARGLNQFPALPHLQSIMPTKRKRRKDSPVRGIRRKSSKSSPRKNQRSPQLARLAKQNSPPPRNELNYLEIAETHDRYLRVFCQVPDGFWQAIESIRRASDQEIGNRGHALVDEAIREIPRHLRRFLPIQFSEWKQPSNEWKQSHIRPVRVRRRFLPMRFSEALIKAVRESGKNGFPTDHEKRARFLAKSLARNGTARPRTSSDNCPKARQILGQQAEETATTGYILRPIV